MDHKGPEHHYDEVECPECGTFWQQGEIQPETVRNNCPNCDYDLRSGTGGRPYRGQPSEINSEMIERNTPLDGASKDRGGNSTQTGIFAKSIIEEAQEETEQKTDPTKPAGLGETHPVKDNQWKPGDRSDRANGRDEMLGSVRHADFKSDDKIWNQVVEDFESAENHGIDEDSTGKVAAAPWLENDDFNSNVPTEHLGWDVVDVVEPDRELLEAQNKYSMPIPNGITNALHDTLVELNAWVENPEENGKLRPYKEYWSVIRPKFDKENSIQIGVEDPHHADIINHVARTNDTSGLNKQASFKKEAIGPWLAPLAEGLGAAGLAEGAGAAGLAEGGGLLSGAANIMKGALNPLTGLGGLFGGDDAQEPAQEAPGYEQGESYYSSLKTADEYALKGEQNIYGEDPAKRSPLPPGTQKTLQQIEQFAPSGYTAYPSGAGEASGTRLPSGQIAPRTQQQPASEQVWNAFNVFNPPAGWEAPADAEAQLEAAGLAKEQNEAWDEYSKRIEKDYMANPKKYDSKKIQALKYALGFVPAMWKNLTAQPNIKEQTKGAPGTAQGPSYFSNTREATYGDEYEHPSSITRRIEDPVNGGIDPHQRSDENNDDWAYDMLDVNEIGQSRNPHGEDQVDEKRRRLFTNESKTNEEFYDSLSEGMTKFFNALPLIMDYFNSEESGFEDPIVKSVHEALEAENPGYLDLGNLDGENEILLLLSEEPEVNSKEKKSNFFGPSTMVTQTPGATKMTLGEENPSTGSKCHNCGAVLDPSDKICPNCSAPSTSGEGAESGTNPAWPYGTAQNLIQPYMSQPKRTSSNHQGPHTDEQQAAVAELLVEQDRVDEIPNMIDHGEQYDDELAEIQNRDETLIDGDVEDLPQPPQEQPMPNQGMPPGIPPMGAPSPADLGAPGPSAGSAPGIMASMLTAAFKHGADNVAGKCPKCDSHTTKMVQQDGVSKCHTCNHQWKDDTFEKADGDSSNSSTTAAYHKALEEIESQHLDSFTEPEEELEIDDSTHEWLDENGEPLQEGKEYEIYAHDYDIPDVGRIVEIKPDAIVYELESDGGLRTTIEIDRQEADQNGYRFVESGVSSEENSPGIEENMDSKPVPVPGQTTDLSTPHIQIGSSTKISFEDYDEALVTEAIEWLLSLDGPYVFNDFEGLSQEEYQDEILNMHPDYILRAVDQHYGGGLDQLARDTGIVSQDDNPEENLSAFGKTAGRHYTPMEQRELIDEYGEARNADKLDLENTHYAQADDDYFLFGC